MRRTWIAVMCAALGGCPGEEPPACTTVDTACAPLYQPTFDNVFNNTLRTGCGSGRSACHSASGDGGASFADPVTAYDTLRASYVQPGEPGCSALIVRVEGVGTDYQMPPGAPLPAAERCALIQWVQAGAPGPSAALRAAHGGK